MKKFFLALGITLLPIVASAQIVAGGTPQTGQLDTLINTAIRYAGLFVGFLMTLATIYFIYTVFGLITEKDAKARGEKKSQVTWAVIGLAIMVCVWGLIRFAASTLGISTTQSGIQVPCPLGQTYVPASAIAPGGCR